MLEVTVIGGGVMGAATACFLARDHGARVTVLERDPSYARASSSLSLSSIRQQFSQPVNIALSRWSLAFLHRAADELAVADDRPALGLVEPGYLYLATDAGAATLRQLHALQRTEGVDVALLAPAELAARFPWLAVDDLGRGVGELDRLAQQAGGTMVSTKGEGTVVVTLKVPVEGMDNVLVSMEKLGEVRESKVSAQSLAPIIAEQEQRLAALRDEVVRLETLIGEDPDDDGIKELKTQLGKVQAEISAETDKLGTLKSDLLWATIQVNLVLR